MNRARPRPHGLVTRTLEEAIESVATRPIRDSVIRAALREAGRSSIPERGLEVLEFAAGPLMRSLSLRVGEETATEVLRQVAPVLKRASMRPSLAPQGPSRPPVLVDARPTRPAEPASDDDEESGVFVARSMTDPAPSGALPVILLATHDADAAFALAVRLGGRATVRVVQGLLDLLDALDEADTDRWIVVLDGARPTVQVPSILTVAPDLVGRAEIVVWRAESGDRATLAQQIAGSGWHACEGAATQLAATCERVIARR